MELDESIPNEVGLYIPIKVDRWTGKDGAIESYGRGKVVACGPGGRNQKTGRHERMLFTSTQGIRPVQEGDVIRFSELIYPEDKVDGKRYALITEGDVVGVEV